MNTQKIFLFIAIFLTVFLLWDKWELTQTTDEYGNTITQTSIVASDSQDNTIDVPEVSDIPSCSEYTLEAIKSHGTVRGIGLGAKRISKCHPWSEAKFDPVPKKLPN